jgi:hypothetical protein
MDLTYSQITELPNNLTVRGDLFLHGTKIKNLPADLKVGGTIYKD